MRSLFFEVVITVHILATRVVQGHPARPALPLCTEDKNRGQETRLHCIVFADQFLNYDDIRKFTVSHPNTEKFNVSINCYSGGIVRLPWPFFAKNVVSLQVSGCTTEGLLSERTQIQVYPNELRRVVVTDVKHNVTLKDLYDSVVNLKSLSKDYECGLTAASVQIFRNVGYIFPESSSGQTEMMMIDELFSALTMQEFLSHNTVCDYPDLQYLEESGSRSFSAFHLKFMETSRYPKLEVYSLRNNSLPKIPSELQNVKQGFTPNLSLLDLADNEINEMNFVLGGPGKTNLLINLQRNFIRNMPRALLQELMNSRTTVLDLRGNPLICSCELFEYGRYLLTLPQSSTIQDIYRELTCTREQNGVSKEYFIYDNGVCVM